MKHFAAISLLILGVATISSFALPQKKANEGKRLIKTSETKPGTWMTQEEIFGIIRNKVHFMDITDHQTQPSKVRTVKRAFPTEAKYQSIVKAIIPNISTPRMESFIKTFSEFHNRFYSDAFGVEASAWLQSQVQQTFEASNYSAAPVTVEAIKHAWIQNSIIARIEGSDPALKSEIVIIGAHLDSINRFDPLFGRAPGADDDASGSVVLLETFRLLLNSGFIPKRTVEFHWYSAEEVGLRGAENIAWKYYGEKRNVIAMGQYDVVGYTPANSNLDIGIVLDYTDSGLNDFIRTMIGTYTTSGWKNITCGYACSDYAMWHGVGYPAAFTCEHDFTPYLHTEQDTIETVNFEYVTQFVRLALGFIVELAEPLYAITNRRKVN